MSAIMSGMDAYALDPVHAKIDDLRERLSFLQGQYDQRIKDLEREFQQQSNEIRAELAIAYSEAADILRGNGAVTGHREAPTKLSLRLAAKKVLAAAPGKTMHYRDVAEEISNQGLSERPADDNRKRLCNSVRRTMHKSEDFKLIGDGRYRLLNHGGDTTVDSPSK